MPLNKHRLKKKWSERDTVKFVELYETEEVLWNFKLKEYKNKYARNAAVARIIHNLGIDGVTVQELNVKINNIRSTYLQERAKIKKSAPNIYVPSLVWYDIADRFLSEIVKPKKKYPEVPTSAAPSTSNNAITGLKDEKIEHITVEATFESNLDPLQETQPSETIEADLKPYVRTPSSEQYEIKPAKRKPFRRPRPYIENTVLNAIQRLENRVSNVIDSTQQETRGQKEDEFHMFALSVAAQLRQLPLHIAVATQSKIQSALSDARLSSIFSDTLSSTAVSIKTEDTSTDG